MSEIEGDSIAKKELKGRLTAYQNMLFNSLYLNFENADWIFNKEKIEEQNLSSIASYVSDKVFNLTPIIHNELVVRDRISSMSMNGSVNLLKLICLYMLMNSSFLSLIFSELNLILNSSELYKSLANILLLKNHAITIYLIIRINFKFVI